MPHWNIRKLVMHGKVQFFFIFPVAKNAGRLIFISGSWKAGGLDREKTT